MKSDQEGTQGLKIGLQKRETKENRPSYELTLGTEGRKVRKRMWYERGRDGPTKVARRSPFVWARRSTAEAARASARARSPPRYKPWLILPWLEMAARECMSSLGCCSIHCQRTQRTSQPVFRVGVAHRRPDDGFVECGGPRLVRKLFPLGPARLALLGCITRCLRSRKPTEGVSLTRLGLERALQPRHSRLGLGRLDLFGCECQGITCRVRCQYGDRTTNVPRGRFTVERG